ncbi:hypothetical protein ACHAXR_008593 [Thalassiosira sp. AJA248-18]
MILTTTYNSHFLRLGGGEKICCSIPIEFKLQDTSGLGFPIGWRFSFGDPQKLSLVWGTKRILSLAGLAIVSPDGKLFHSLESAFAHISHSSISSAIDILEKFLVHVGSSHYASVSNHFLVGKNYCTEFTNERGSNVVLFGKVMACMMPGTNNEDYESPKTFFIVQYDHDVLCIAKSMGVKVQPIQLVSSELAWGGCISYERRIHCRREAHSAIRNIDQATAVETWVSPDMRLEAMMEQPDGTSLPQLTIFTRGYKFVFSVRVKVSENGSKRQYGVFAMCTAMQESADQEITLKPGEMIDLGIFSPLREEDRKTLPAFIIKNYIHLLKVGKWGVVSGEDNIVYDLTDDKTGQLHDLASKRVLSYIQKRTKSDFPLIHARLDPCGQVHLLFGIPYEGSWVDYESGMQRLVPLFCGREVEVTISRQHGLGKKDMAGSKYLQSISMFQLQDILESNSQLDNMIDSETINQFPSSLIDRCKQVLKCLDERTQKLLEMCANANKSKEERVSSRRDNDGPDISLLNSSLEHSRELARVLEGYRKNSISNQH